MQINALLRTALIWGILLIPFIPTVVSTSMFFPFITGKNFLFRFLVEILFGVWLLLAWRDSAFRPRFSWILAALAAFLAIITFADILGENFSKSFWSNYERMEGLVTHLHLFAYFLVVTSVLTTEILWRRFFHVSIGVSIFIIIYGILQLAGEFVINQGGVRLDGTLGNATYLAVYMLFHIFITAFWAFRSIRLKRYTGDVMLSGLVGFGLFTLWSFIRAGNPNIDLGSYEKGFLLFSVLAVAGLSFLYAKYRNHALVHHVLYGTLILTQGTILYYTATRGAILGLAAGILVSAVAIFFFKRESKVVKRAALGAGIALVVLAGSLFLLRDSSFVRESPVLGRLVSISYNDAESRFLIWNMSLQGFQEKPLLGWGQENFNLVFNKYYDPRMYDQEPWFDRAHNIVFDWLIAAGALGLLSYFSIFSAALYYLLVRRRKEEEAKTTRKKGERRKAEGDDTVLLFSPVGKSILLGLLAAYAFHNLFVFDQIVSYILFFSVLAFIHTEAVGRTPVPQLFSFKPKNPMVHHTVTAAMLVLTPFLIYGANYNGYLANKSLLQAIAPQGGGVEENLKFFEKALSYGSLGTVETREQLAQFAINNAGADVPAELKQRIFTLASQEMNAQVEKVPDDARYRMFYAMVLLAYGQNDRAIETLVAATDISPKKQQIYFLLANAHIGRGNIEGALDATRTAFNAEPSNENARKFYAAAAILAGEDARAEELLSHFEHHPIDDLFVRAYTERGNREKLAQIWENRIAFEPENPQHYVNLANTYVELGRYEDAILQLEEAIRIEPRFKEQGEGFISEIRAGRKP